MTTDGPLRQDARGRRRDRPRSSRILKKRPVVSNRGCGAGRESTAAERAGAAALSRALLGRPLPRLWLESTRGPANLAELARDPLVLFIYPHATGLPEAPVPGWDSVPGARGCTAESCAFRDRQRDLEELGSTIAGLSVQPVDEQLAFAARMGLRYRLISDPTLRLAAVLGLPTFELAGRAFYRRITLLAADGRITRAFYPIRQPEQHASAVIEWLAAKTRGQ